MSDPAPNDVRLSVSLLDMLAQIRKDQADGFAQLKQDQAERFTRLEVGMSGKADKADVARMEARLDAHGKALDEHRGQIAELEMQSREENRARNVVEATNTWWRSRMARAGAFLVGLALIVTAGVATAQLFH